MLAIETSVMTNQPTYPSVTSGYEPTIDPEVGNIVSTDVGLSTDSESPTPTSKTMHRSVITDVGQTDQSESLILTNQSTHRTASADFGLTSESEPPIPSSQPNNQSVTAAVVVQTSTIVRLTIQI